MSYYAPAVVDSTTVGVVWHERSDSDAEAYYAEVEVGATSATSPVLIDSSSSLSYERQPAVTSFGTTRVATWFAEGASRAETALFSAASCDGGATWRATSTVASGDDVSVRDAVVAISGTVVTAFWREYDALRQRVPLASSIDDPCAVAVPLEDGPELADTGASDVSLAALVAALGMLVLGVFAVAARRAMVRQ